jgi:hypothetical protein
VRGIAGASRPLMPRDFARGRTELLCFERFMFSSSFFRVRMHDVCAGDLIMSSWSPSRPHRGPAETLRELSVGKTMATGISREQAPEVAQERIAATCYVKCEDDRYIIEFLNALFFWSWSPKRTVSPACFIPSLECNLGLKTNN